MEIVYSKKQLIDYISRSADVTAGHPILIDQFLEDAFEFDVDALCDGESVHIGAVMQHIEEAGIHSRVNTRLFYVLHHGANVDTFSVTKSIHIELKCVF